MSLIEVIKNLLSRKRCLVLPARTKSVKMDNFSSCSRRYRVACSCPVAHAENFHGGCLVQGQRWPFVFGVRCLWRHNLTSFTCFQTNVLATFVDIICTFFYIHTPYFMRHCTEYKLWALQVRLAEKNNINATTQQFITAKISGCALKQGGETHSSLRQSKLQLQNQAALRSRHIRAVEHWRRAAGLAGAHPGLRDRILLNYTRTENAHKVRKKMFVFCDV